MTDSTAEFLLELGRRGHEPLLEKGTGTVRFDLLDGARIDRWLVTLDKGDVLRRCRLRCPRGENAVRRDG
jgi:hypothetical protein